MNSKIVNNSTAHPIQVINNPNYQMSASEILNVNLFLKEISKFLPPNRFLIFRKLVQHLCSIQNPTKKTNPIVDSVIHGIEAARFCLMKGDLISEELLLSAIGHDWDRSCGNKRILPTNYPKTKEGHALYKKDHALNSAKLFCLELTKLYNSDLVKKVYSMIERHEEGGDGDLAILDFADGAVFFHAENVRYYREERMYKDNDGGDLDSKSLEFERKKWFRVKIDFMMDTMSVQDQRFIVDYLKKTLHKYSRRVRFEVEEIMNIKFAKFLD